MKNKLRERDIEEAFVRYAKTRKCLIYKFSSPSHRGVCDRIVIAPSGLTGYFEVKRPGEEPTPLQQKFINDVKKQGAHSAWFDNVAEGKKCIDDLIFLSLQTRAAVKETKQVDKIMAEAVKTTANQVNGLSLLELPTVSGEDLLK